jgi:hypothetical protein
MSLVLLSVLSSQFILVIILFAWRIPELSFIIFHAVLILLDEIAIWLWKYCFFASFITLFNVLLYFWRANVLYFV